MKIPPYKIFTSVDGDIKITISDEDREWSLIVTHPGYRAQYPLLYGHFVEAMWVRTVASVSRCPTWVREILTKYIQTLR